MDFATHLREFNLFEVFPDNPFTWFYFLMCFLTGMFFGKVGASFVFVLLPAIMLGLMHFAVQAHLDWPWD